MSTSMSASPELIKALENTEKNRSPFEEEIRRMPLPVINTFVDGGRIVPAGFEAAKETFTDNSIHPGVEAGFPRLYTRGLQTATDGLLPRSRPRWPQRGECVRA